MGKNETEKVCGILHDLVEDTNWTFEELEKEGFSKEIIEVLKLITKESDNEDYSNFIQRVMTNKTAISVKLNDLRDNMDITRLKELTNNDLKRLNKYLKAYRLLIEQQ
jgi:(p)ppGpp synthase/HD superfamily hydrolase